MQNINIIGAGPIGCYIGGILAKNGFNVDIYEEHSSIGKPMHCTGIVTQELSNLVNLEGKDFVLNALKKVRVYSKNNFIEIPSNDIVIDRQKFDNYIADKAGEYGAKINLNSRFLGIEKNNIIIEELKSRKIILKDRGILIGADGAFSKVEKLTGQIQKKFYFGIQARIKGKFDKNSYSVYLGSICPGFFAWIVPESDKIARIGLAAEKNPGDYFDNFLKILKINKKDIIERYGGPIPIFNKIKVLSKNNIFLVGDAASQVKATTCGGLVPGLKAAKILSDCIINNKDYNKELKKMNFGLSIHLKARKFLNKFSDKDYDKLLSLIKKEKIKEILCKHNRDSPSKMLPKIIINQPKFLFFYLKMVFRKDL